MRLGTSVSSVGIVGALLCAASAATAAESDYPLSYVERPIVLPPMTLAPSAQFEVEHDGGDLGRVTSTFLEIGAKFGVIDNLEVHATVIPLQLTHKVEYEPPIIGATYRFLKGDFELGAQVDFSLGFFHSDLGENFGVTPGLPARLHIGREAALDFGFFLPIIFPKRTFVGEGITIDVDEPSVVVGAQIPVQFAYDITEPFHIGVKSGLEDVDLGHFGRTFYVPLGFVAGYAIGDKKPIVDIDPFFEWPFFLTPGTQASADKLNPGVWQLGVEVTGYFYL